jgi:hypothetical protein
MLNSGEAVKECPVGARGQEREREHDGSTQREAYASLERDENTRRNSLYERDLVTRCTWAELDRGRDGSTRRGACAVETRRGGTRRDETR